MGFYELSQNNTGGLFDVDDKVCHRLFIEADSEDSAKDIAESLGCYWDGVDSGIDCECCGDRWYGVNEVDLNNINLKWKGYEVSEWFKSEKDYSDYKGGSIDYLKSIYPGSTWIEEPKVEKKYGQYRVVGKLRIDDIEQYAQLMADLYGWTKPDCRIFYKDGTIKEVFTRKKTKKS